MASYSPSRTLVISRSSSRPKGLPVQKTTTFGSGRQAVYALSQHLALEGGHVLLPAWVPEGIQLPFTLAGWNIDYYELDGQANPEWQALTNLLEGKKIDLVVLIHYFGQIRDVAKLRQMLPEACCILEDWAHTHPTTTWPTPAPTDWALFSPTKLIGTPDGAWLVGPQSLKQYYSNSHSLTRWAFLSWQFLYLLASTILNAGIPGRIVWNKLSGGGYARAYRLLVRLTSSPNDISMIGKWLLAHTNHDQLEHSRIGQARYYLAHISNPHIEFIQSGLAVLPWIGFPLRLKNRAHFASYLADHGIRGQQFTDRWWFTPNTSRFPSARALWKNHYLLPIRQDFTLEDISTIVSIVNAYVPAMDSD